MVELRAWAEEERSEKGPRRIGARTLAVLVDLLARPGPAAVQSISELAAHNGVDPSTLTRLGQSLGLGGFARLQEIFQQHVAATQPFYSTRVQALTDTQVSQGDGGALGKLAQSECQKILAVAHALSDAQIARAVKQLLKAKQVYVLGLRATYSLSFFFGTFLGTLREGVTILGGPGAPMAYELARITKSDLLVAVSFRPYTRSVVKAVELLRANGTQVLSLTDSGSAIEVEPPAGVTLAVDQPFYFDSALAQIFVLEAILIAVARELGAAAVAVNRRREMFNKAFDLELN
jgi:DNA-binding MurR/RpiR family transcriptional regulator